MRWAALLGGALLALAVLRGASAQCTDVDNYALTYFGSFQFGGTPNFDSGNLANNSQAFTVGTGGSRIHGLRPVMVTGCTPGSMMLTVVGLSGAAAGVSFESPQNLEPWDTIPLSIPPGQYRLTFTSYALADQMGSALDGPSFLFSVGLSGTFFDVYNDIGMGKHPSTSNVPHTAMTLFDCNDDGYPDLLANKPYRIVYSDSSAGGLRFAADLQGLATGLSGSGERGIAWGDFNNQGSVEVLTARNAAVQTQQKVAECDSWALSWQPGYNNDEAVMFADINGDGRLDIFDPGQPYKWFDGMALDATASGEILFPGITAYPWIDNTNTEGSTSADFNGDGFPDFMWTDYEGTHVILNMQGGLPFQYSAYATAGVFGLPDSVSEHEYVSWSWGDCDNDGLLDLVLLGRRSGFFKNRGAGKFEELSPANSGLNLRSGVSFRGDWGDFDSDGDLDFFLVRDDNENVGGLYVNNGDCTFVQRAGWIPSSMIRTSTDTRVPYDLSDMDDEAVIAGDVDADGRLDIIHSDGYILYNRGEPAPGKANLQVRLKGLGDGNSPVTPMGATVRVYDSFSHELLSHRELISGTNHLQPFWLLHAGAVPSDRPLDIVAWFPSSQRHKIYRHCRVGNLSLAVGTANVVYSPALEIVEPTAAAATLTAIPSLSARRAEVVWCGCDSAGQPGGPVVDACGVCGGNGSSCSGCEGRPNTKLDECGVCDGDGSTCIGCDGSPGTGRIIDACSVCGGDNSICSGCDGVPNSGVLLDRCGVCGGSGVCTPPSSNVQFVYLPTKQTKLRFEPANYISDLNLLDCNGDGFDDIAISLRDTNGPFVISENLGTLAFGTAHENLGSGYRSISWGDVNDDGKVDVVVRSSCGATLFHNSGAETGGGCRSFSRFQNSALSSCIAPENNNENVFVFDVDGDGDLDIVDPGTSVMWHEQIDTMNGFLFVDNGGNGFDVASYVFPGIPKPGNVTWTPYLPFPNGEGSTAADFTNDGLLDLVYFTGTGVVAYVPTRNSSSGLLSYTYVEDVTAVFGLPGSVDVYENSLWLWGDCDNDGDLDVFVTGSVSVGLYQNNGAGIFTFVSAASGIAGILSAAGVSVLDGGAWGDYDNDGDLDLVLTPGILMRNGGVCDFSDSSNLLPSASDTSFKTVLGSGYDVAFSDLDRDGDVDMILSSGEVLNNNMAVNLQKRFLNVWAWGNGTGQGSKDSPRTPLGAKMSVWSSDLTTLVGFRELTPSFGNTQSSWIQHFGGVDPATEYAVRVVFPSGRTQTYVHCRPSLLSAVAPAGNTLNQTLIVVERTASDSVWAGGREITCSGCGGLCVAGSTASATDSTTLSTASPSSLSVSTTLTLVASGTAVLSSTGLASSSSSLSSSPSSSSTTSLSVSSSVTSSDVIGTLLMFILIGAAVCCICVAFVVCIVYRKRRRHAPTELGLELRSIGSTPAASQTPMSPVYDDLRVHSKADADYSAMPSHFSSPQSAGDYSAMPRHLSSANFPVDSHNPSVRESVRASNHGTMSKAPTLSSWEILVEDIVFGEEIGAGSFGVVYAGVWRGAPVAIKSLSSVRTSQREIDDFKAEAQLMSTLRPHSNVVQFQGMASDTGTLYLVTEFCSGGSLYGLLHGPADITLAQKLAFAKGIAAAMLHLSSEGLIHRDLAARNVLLSESGTVKVGDFGMSRLVEGVEGATTQSNVGPLKWMAKESLIERIYSEKSDVYSFGVTLFEIVSRCEPHEGTPGYQVATRMASEATRPILESVANISPQLQGVIEACTAYQPAGRPTFAELTKRLASF